jgi:D-glycero-D-manno-heptose 1,7-bisphosphate phosphatase
MLKLILLDRDGVLNKDRPDSVKNLGEFIMLPGAAQAVKCLNDAGFKVAVVTNQGAVGRGELTLEGLEQIHQELQRLIGLEGGRLDRIYYCPDTTIEPHRRRKPAPGMVLEAMADFACTPAETLVIGDALRDLEAAWAAGCQSILVRTGKGQATEQALHTNPMQPTSIFDDLTAAAAFLKSCALCSTASHPSPLSPKKSEL